MKRTLVLYPNSADGLASAAVFQLAHPQESINFQVCFVSTVAETLKKNFSDQTAEIHLLGVGVYDDYLVEIQDAMENLRLDRKKIIWYCGRGYLDQFQKDLMLHCTTVFTIDSASPTNTATIIKNFQIPESSLTNHLLNIAFEFHKNYDIEKKHISKINSKWQKLIEALCGTHFKLGRQKDFTSVITHLSEAISWFDIYDEIITNYKDQIDAGKLLTEGKSKYARDIRKKIDVFAGTHQHILILGPSGTGKDLAAQDIHNISKKKGQFKAINCSDFNGNPDMARSKLFGHTKGSFTGAEHSMGAFEICNEGTLFLDEVGEMPLQAQASLLRALENMEFESLGSDEVKTSSARIIAATNRDLRQMVANKEFREDLFYRLNVLTLNLQPLCQRIEDVPLIIKSILRRKNNEVKDSNQHYELTDVDIEAIQDYHWPGNFRELRNLLSRALLTQNSLADCIKEEKMLAEKSKILNSLTGTEKLSMPLPTLPDDILPLEEIKKYYLKHAYKICNNNCKETASRLKIAINTARSYLEESN